MRSPSPRTSVATSTFEESYATLSRGDYATALKGFRTLAERGDADAQHNLGAMYASGEGVVQDNTEAVRWYRKAAEQGHADAQNKLGVMYGEAWPEMTPRRCAGFATPPGRATRRVLPLRGDVRRTGRSREKIRALVPELDDLVLRQRLLVKHRYDGMLTNMNERQIARLDSSQIAAFNRVFRHHRDLLDRFGYEMLAPRR